MSIWSSAFARSTLGFMLAGVAIILAIILTAFWLASRTGDNVDDVVASRDVRTLATGVLESILDAETSQRGYLLSGNPEYLDAYKIAQPKLNAYLDRLRERVAKAPDGAPTSARLIVLVDAKSAELAQTIELAASGNRQAALDIVQTNLGKDTMTEARDILNGVLDKSEGRVAVAMDNLNDDTDKLTWIVLLGGGLIMILSLAAVWTVARYTGQLIEARQDVETMNLSLERRVEERTAALSHANDEIQRFAYIVTHDLRAPLVNIMGFTRELELGLASVQKVIDEGGSDTALVEAARHAASDDLPEAVSFIRASTAKMDGLINAILKLSREGRRRLYIESIDLAKLFDTTIASLRHQADEVGARIELIGTFPSILSDRLALEQIFGNLLDNGVKYLAPGRPGLIAIQAEQTRDRVEITVNDNGRGIAPQDHERIFELYRRAGAQDRPGEGIGLAHVRQLVRRLGGEIVVQSRLGEGSVFKITLPKTLTIKEG